ncbi:BT_3928 family protein [Maribacter sp.]|uniref:BT_3928 family protein n=1 Tax=Maribacter sp. TaxID=1897614 RepID=UPI003298C933
MKYLVGVVRIFVGILFIISGFIKLNDPVGFSFKLEEYFSQGVLDLPFLTPFALAISILVVIVEVMVGVMLILGYKRKITIWTLIAMIVFFTFLTFYSAYFNKVTDCGCFGDAIKLTPWESFTKDVVLLVLILIIYVGRKFITPLVNSKALMTALAVSFFACIGYVYYVLNHLPVIDFRPYEIGKNIEEGMSTPEDAPKAIFEYKWKFNVNGNEEIHVTTGDYPTVNGDFVDVETEEIQAGYEPPVHDFTIEQEGEDFAASLLQEPKLVMVIAYDLRKSNLEEFKNIKSVADKAIKAGYKVIGMSASGPDQTNALIKEYNLDFDFYFTDETTLKTIVRSNPGVLVLKKGTIKQKVHYNDIEDLIFN